MLIPGRAETLFLQALDMPPAERPSFVAAACADDADLLREVTTLLAAAGASEPYFDDLAARVREAILDDAAAPPMPDRIGAWRLLRLLGRGGMGAVYLAERADGQYEARAALKILPVGIRDDASRTRFLAERQILARLVHDNITRLLDGGVTDDGTPYFVMDYVEGTTIDAYCDERRLGLDDRLDLFLEVCDTVQFAHRALVIHRDIKPGNVLVDDNGTVRLLDFGIAKLLDDDELAPEPTRLARRPLTPSYASPEMLLAQPVDVTTDVYSLGVLCYGLLTGRLPFDLRGLSAAQMEARLQTSSPPPASQAVLREDAAGEEAAAGAAGLAAHRRLEPRRLSAWLRGDLDVILATALAREKERRYASVELMAQDIRRYRSGLPIVARPPTLAYRGGKFLRRHRIGIAAAGLLAAMLLGITGLSIRHAVVTERQSREIAAERDRAEEVKAFLQEIFWAADPSVAQGEELTARQILDRGAERLAGEMHDRPRLRAELLDTVAEVYQGLGFFAESRPLVEEVAAFRRDADGEDSTAYAEALNELAFVEEQLGRYERALEHAEKSAAIRRAHGSPAELADSLLVQGRLLHRLGRLDEVRPLYMEALAVHRAAAEGPDERLAHTLVSLGALEMALGNIDEAEALQREALAMRLALYPEPATELVESQYNLGTVLHQRGKYEEAREAYNAALDIARTLSPEEGHPDEVYMLNGLARVHESLGDDANAEAMFREAALVVRRHLGDSHPNLGIVQFNLARVLLRQGGCAAAEPVLAETVAILAEAAPGVAVLAHARARLGQCRLEAGRLEEAEALLSAGFGAHRASLGLEHEETKASLAGLIAVLERRGDGERAAEYRALSVAVPE